ncbi:hypothetical protein BHE74_00024951 [Ensete ventricosum]|nr:hypothetical protein BHE74_00024951 [Ensete ventricosum]
MGRAVLSSSLVSLRPRIPAVSKPFLPNSTPNDALRFPSKISRGSRTRAAAVSESPTGRLFPRVAAESTGPIPAAELLKVVETAARTGAEVLAFSTSFYLFLGQLPFEVTALKPFNIQCSQVILYLVFTYSWCVQGVRRLGAAAVDMSHVALGIVEAYWEYRLKPWDMAAGVLVILSMVEEAGGAVTRMDGGKFTVFDRSVLVSNGIVHEKVVVLQASHINACRAVSRVLPPPQSMEEGSSLAASCPGRSNSGDEGSTGIIDLRPPGSSPAVDLTDRVHLLPCSIKLDGPCPVSHYFKPKQTGPYDSLLLLLSFSCLDEVPLLILLLDIDLVVDDLCLKEAFFRGRKLQGVTVPLPAGYRGCICDWR